MCCFAGSVKKQGSTVRVERHSVCGRCNGKGHFQEHEFNCPGGGDYCTQHCPVDFACPDCHETGTLVTYYDVEYPRDIVGVIEWRIMPNRGFCTVKPLLYNQADLTYISYNHLEDAETFFDEAWMYKTVDEAVAAMEAWDGTGEPQGWVRHSPSGRRRPHRDDSQRSISQPHINR